MQLCVRAICLRRIEMTLTALCGVFLDKNSLISVRQIFKDMSEGMLAFEKSAYELEFSDYALYPVRYIDYIKGRNVLQVWVTEPNDGYKKADF